MADEHNLRDGDTIIYEQDSDNTESLMFFTDAGQVYKAKVDDFEPCKASQVGDYVPTKLNFETGEKVVGGICINKESDGGNVVFVFNNGKGVKIPLESYVTKASRRKLTNAMSTANPCVYVGYEKTPYDVMIVSENGRGLVVSSENIPLKTTRNSNGSTLMTLKAKNFVKFAEAATEAKYGQYKKYKKSIPSSGALLDKK
jgi:DNA gyrase subunit A